MCEAYKEDEKSCVLSCCDRVVRVVCGLRPLVPVCYSLTIDVNKKLRYRRGTARCVVSIEILPTATQ